MHLTIFTETLKTNRKLLGKDYRKTNQCVLNNYHIIIAEKIKTFGNLLAKTKWKKEKEFQSNFLLPWFAISNFRQHFHRSESLLLSFLISTLISTFNKYFNKSFLISTKTAKLLDNFWRKLSILMFRKIVAWFPYNLLYNLLIIFIDLWQGFELHFWNLCDLAHA